MRVRFVGRFCPTLCAIKRLAAPPLLPINSTGCGTGTLNESGAWTQVGPNQPRDALGQAADRSGRARVGLACEFRVIWGQRRRVMPTPLCNDMHRHPASRSAVPWRANTTSGQLTPQTLLALFTSTGSADLGGMVDGQLAQPDLSELQRYIELMKRAVEVCKQNV